MAVFFLFQCFINVMTEDDAPWVALLFDIVHHRHGPVSVMAGFCERGERARKACRANRRGWALLSVRLEKEGDKKRSGVMAERQYPHNASPWHKIDVSKYAL